MFLLYPGQNYIQYFTNLHFTEIFGVPFPNPKSRYFLGCFLPLVFDQSVWIPWLPPQVHRRRRRSTPCLSRVMREFPLSNTGTNGPGGCMKNLPKPREHDMTLTWHPPNAPVFFLAGNIPFKKNSNVLSTGRRYCDSSQEARSLLQEFAHQICQPCAAVTFGEWFLQKDEGS